MSTVPGRVYLVGGAVRDALLGLPVRERDWVVVGATPEQMEAAGFRPRDPDFPVFLHPETGEEYALARREIKTGAGYRGFRVEAGPEVTLEEDLARRDLTINAMARDAEGRLIDPFGGQQDLEDGRLRHVTPAFVEDPVRLLRIARFAARLGAFGFRVAHGTHALMRRMVADGAVDELEPPRIWKEMRQALESERPGRFFEVLAACGALAVLLPDLSARLGAGHARAGVPAPLRALERLSREHADPELRLLTLLLDGDDPPERLLRAGVPRRLVERIVEARALYASLRAMDTATGAELAALLESMGAWRGDGRFETLLAVFRAWPDMPEERLARLEAARRAGREVDVGALARQGLSGRALGEAVAAARRDRALAAWRGT